MSFGAGPGGSFPFLTPGGVGTPGAPFPLITNGGRFPNPKSVHQQLTLGRRYDYAGNNKEAQQFLSRGGQVIIRMRGLPYDASAKQVVSISITILSVSFNLPESTPCIVNYSTGHLNANLITRFVLKVYLSCKTSSFANTKQQCF